MNFNIEDGLVLTFPDVFDPVRSSLHWKDGGTGVTNFSDDSLARYVAAIRAYHTEYPEAEYPRLRISFLSIASSPLLDYMSLHFMTPRVKSQKDLGTFWMVFDEFRDGKRELVFNEVKAAAETFKWVDLRKFIG